MADKYKSDPRQESSDDRHACTRLLSCVALFVALSVTLGSAPQTQPSRTHPATSSSSASTGSRAGRSTIHICRCRRSDGWRREARWPRACGPVNPTVTWPNHTTLITGVTPAKHGVLFNGLLKRDPGVPPRVEPWLPRDEMVRVKTLYDIAHARGMTTAQVDWVAILAAPTVTWEFPERPAPDGEIAQELVKAGVLSQTELETFATRNIVWRDHIWTAGGRAHHPAAQAEPDDVPPAQPRLDTASLRPAHARGDDDDGAPRHAGRTDRRRRRAGRADVAHHVLRRVRSRVQAGQAADPAERGVHEGGAAQERRTARSCSPRRTSSRKAGRRSCI